MDSCRIKYAPNNCDKGVDMYAPVGKRKQLPIRTVRLLLNLPGTGRFFAEHQRKFQTRADTFYAANDRCWFRKTTCGVFSVNFKDIL